MTAALVVAHDSPTPYSVADVTVCPYMGAIESTRTTYVAAGLADALAHLGQPDPVLVVRRLGVGYDHARVPLDAVAAHVRQPTPSRNPDLRPRPRWKK